LVERNLAKVEVESSRLFSRSKFETGSLGFPFLSVDLSLIANTGKLWACGDVKIVAR
jgi:hypothetical protein